MCLIEIKLLTPVNPRYSKSWTSFTYWWAGCERWPDSAQSSDRGGSVILAWTHTEGTILSAAGWSLCAHVKNISRKSCRILQQTQMYTERHTLTQEWMLTHSMCQFCPLAMTQYRVSPAVDRFGQFSELGLCVSVCLYQARLFKATPKKRPSNFLSCCV